MTTMHLYHPVSNISLEAQWLQLWGLCLGQVAIQVLCGGALWKQLWKDEKMAKQLSWYIYIWCIYKDMIYDDDITMIVEW